ncbi:uncharacterized protein LOC126632671 [Malus sylvestris]|uniref:uncharacterized protein LOC126632671 n=1 Tax=Malus sylvestris TaxID=3752 RepID=UPI0021AC5EA9|nr:uncharacterized protein LOC126632671 [Malus sylvestris]
MLMDIIGRSMNMSSSLGSCKVKLSLGWNGLINVQKMSHKFTSMVNLDDLRCHSHLKTLTVMVMVMRIGHEFLSCCRECYFQKQIDKQMAEEDRGDHRISVNKLLHI